MEKNQLIHLRKNSQVHCDRATCFCSLELCGSAILSILWVFSVVFWQSPSSFNLNPVRIYFCCLQPKTINWCDYLHRKYLIQCNERGPSTVPLVLNFGWIMDLGRERHVRNREIYVWVQALHPKFLSHLVFNFSICYIEILISTLQNE